MKAFSSLTSPSKINISLTIFGKEKSSNLHMIKSLLILLDLCDIIYVENNCEEKDVVVFSGSYARDIDTRNNTVVHCMSLLRGLYPDIPTYSFFIQKNIPPGYGLGGGSSNAGTILKFMMKKYKIPFKTILNLAKKIGCDVGFFVHGCSAASVLCSGHKIEKTYDTKDNSFAQHYALIVIDTQPLKTSTVYAHSRPYAQHYMSYFNNDLLYAASQQNTKIKKNIDKIKRSPGCIISGMTGSGSGCFGLFATQKDLVHSIRTHFSNQKYIISRTI